MNYIFVFSNLIQINNGKIRSSKFISFSIQLTQIIVILMIEYWMNYINEFRLIMVKSGNLHSRWSHHATATHPARVASAMNGADQLNGGLIIGFYRVATTMHPLINQRGTRWDNNEHGGPAPIPGPAGTPQHGGYIGLRNSGRNLFYIFFIASFHGIVHAREVIVDCQPVAPSVDCWHVVRHFRSTCPEHVAPISAAVSPCQHPVDQSRSSSFQFFLLILNGEEKNQTTTTRTPVTFLNRNQNPPQKPNRDVIKP